MRGQSPAHRDHLITEACHLCEAAAGVLCERLQALFSWCLQDEEELQR